MKKEDKRTIEIIGEIQRFFKEEPLIQRKFRYIKIPFLNMSQAKNIETRLILRILDKYKFK